MTTWSDVVKNTVAWLANEEGQRRSWYRRGPEIDSPDETFNKFFGDAAVEEFIRWQGNGLTQPQFSALARLTDLMRNLSDRTPESIDREIGAVFVDDPRWKEVIKAAKEALAVL